ncbi:hypothetical protein [Rhodococcus sp. B10]|uniref:hypothetical protein n=1 Tax=Rhodococcus sp. B10 TaxID=2695876 RepID=UPI001431491C|nr:hypothetical protein [Rhodococcus sp. B10]NIL74349.1 hypothetical protein [Rhodococcus sp. B10]
MTVRVLTVMVDGWLIEDGSVRPPAVGEPLAISLEFFRCAEPVTDPRLGSIRAVAHPTLDREPLRHPDGHLQWETVLRGDGWSAAWRADRPVVGQIAENGSFFVDHAGRTEPVRGLVTRVRNVFGTLVYGDQGWIHCTADTLELEDIETSPRWFDNVPGDRDPEPGDSRRHHMGVVIDLDLDNVPPAPIRPRVVPSAVSAAGSTLWLLDGELPVLVRVVDPIGAAAATEYVLPAGVVSALADPRPRRVFADYSGCWVAGRSDVLRCNIVDGVVSVVRFDLGPVRFATARQGSLLVVTEDHVVIISSSGEQQNVSTPSGGLRPVIDCAPTDTGFLLLTLGRPRRTVEVSEIDRSGYYRPGHEIESPVALFVVRTVAGIRVFTYHGVIDARSGETLLAQRFLSGGRIGNHVWIVQHRPSGYGHHGWWPVDDGDQLPPREDGRWLFVVLNPVTFAVLSVRPIETSRPDVTVDEEGRIWIAGLGVRGIERGGRTVELDVASLLS